MAVPNNLNPNFDRISLRSSTAILIGGLATTTAAVLTDVGLLGNGSTYLSSGSTGHIFVVVSGVWTELTIN